MLCGEDVGVGEVRSESRYGWVGSTTHKGVMVSVAVLIRSDRTVAASPRSEEDIVAAFSYSYSYSYTAPVLRPLPALLPQCFPYHMPI
jgi:hypothetical protein